MRTAALLREEAEVLDVVVDTTLAGRDGSRCDSPSSPPRSRGSSCAGSPRPPPGPVRRAATRLDDILALGGDGALDVGDGARAVVEGGVLRFERTPPRRDAPTLPR